MSACAPVELLSFLEEAAFVTAGTSPPTATAALPTLSMTAAYNATAHAQVLVTATSATAVTVELSVFIDGVLVPTILPVAVSQAVAGGGTSLITAELPFAISGTSGLGETTVAATVTSSPSVTLTLDGSSLLYVSGVIAAPVPPASRRLCDLPPPISLQQSTTTFSGAPSSTILSTLNLGNIPTAVEYNCVATLQAQVVAATGSPSTVVVTFTASQTGMTNQVYSANVPISEANELSWDFPFDVVGLGQGPLQVQVSIAADSGTVTLQAAPQSVSSFSVVAIRGEL
jgi:hypothetical protein